MQWFWAFAGADKSPHGTSGQPSTLAAILRHPDLSGKTSSTVGVASVCGSVQAYPVAYAKHFGRHCVSNLDQQRLLAAECSKPYAMAGVKQ